MKLAAVEGTVEAHAARGVVARSRCSAGCDHCEVWSSCRNHDISPNPMHGNAQQQMQQQQHVREQSISDTIHGRAHTGQALRTELEW